MVMIRVSRQTKDHNGLKATNDNLKFDTSLAESRVVADLVTKCIERDKYQKYKRKTKITTETLKRHARNVKAGN